MSEATITVTQVKSSIGTKPKHRGTLRALGLGKIGRSKLHRDTPEFRGRLRKVAFLIKVEEDVNE